MGHPARALVLTLFASLLMPTAGLTQQRVPLAFKFAAGDTIQYDVTISGAGGLTASGGATVPVSV